MLFRVLSKATTDICQYRLLVHGDNDVQFPLDYVREAPDVKWRLLLTASFPRDSRLLHFRLEAKDVPNQGDWRELMTFGQ